MLEIGKSNLIERRYGDLALLAFLTVQAFDGILTYLGILTFGPDIEGNPLISSAMIAFGHGPALTSAKLIATSLGCVLHVRGVHGLVALLTGLYLAAAILPWTALLFF